ncbi:MAG: hypothetical protein M1837_000050 [Sclerophora amabilis]|nr:MAG: hypothetical protein M1837_000050 [Sclerophora amabilis]
MASVSSLDKDLRNMRLSKYTPQAANEVKAWIEECLGETLAGGDLLVALKDGVALCKLVNLAFPTSGVKYKKSSMPFVQMENISHFLRAVQNPPFNLPPHDTFLTVDLYESKDPAQVLQCLGAFSRRAHTLQPSVFTSSIGRKNRNSTMSPQSTGQSNGGISPTSRQNFDRSRGISNASETTTSSFNSTPRRPMAPATATWSGDGKNSKAVANGKGSAPPPGGYSSWSKKSDEGVTAPAWNINQYGYLGGASQGNQGISFGARRQITSAAPVVSTLADKEKKRREEEAEEQERLRVQAEEAEQKRRVEREAEEERERAEEEQRWEEETRRQREKDRLRAEEDRRKWEEQERRWKQDEIRRMEEEKESEARIKSERERKRAGSDARLKGQFLSQYQAEQRPLPIDSDAEDPVRMAERERMRELERELAEARERENRYEMERQERLRSGRGQERHVLEPHVTQPSGKPESQRHRSRSRNRPVASETLRSEESSRYDEREILQKEWEAHQEISSDQPAESTPSFDMPPRPLPDPTALQYQKDSKGPSSRPLPDPASYSGVANRTDRFLASNKAPLPEKPRTHFPNELGIDSNAERHAENTRREASQAKTKAGGWASKSLLEREMERERQRQQEWEEAQKATEDAARKGVGKGEKEGTTGEGGSWDINQYGWTGGDSQNRGGVNFGGRRQIIGPRPPPQH